MRRILPSRAEAAFFAVLALICGLLVRYSPAADVALASMTIPVFIFAGIMGMRRNTALREVEETVYDDGRDFDRPN